MGQACSPQLPQEKLTFCFYPHKLCSGLSQDMGSALVDLRTQVQLWLIPGPGFGLV